MSATPADRTAAIARARASARPEDIVDGVKAVVGDEIRQLSPDATLVETTYFNHSYMPDFVLEWRDQGRRTSRPLFIRNHVSIASVPLEVAALSEREPVLLNLDPIEDETTKTAVRSAIGNVASRMLISDVGSIGALAEPEHAIANEGSPLLHLVRSNILRGGKGLLANEEVNAVTSTSDLDPSSPDAAEQLDNFTAMAAEIFEEASATRLLRAAEILRLATTRVGDPVLAAIEGELADADLRILLPYLLDHQDGIANPEFWAYIGSMMSLARLEEFASVLEERRIEPLVHANLSQWSAKRAQLSFNPLFDEESDDGTSTSWALQAGLLTATAGRYLIAFAADGRRLSGRGINGILPAWPDVDGVAANYRLDRIELQGMVRRVRISAEESGDVAGDVRKINASLEDSFSVQHVSVRVIGTEGASSMTVEFAPSLVTGERPETIENLATTAVDFLGLRQPVSAARRSRLVGRSAVEDAVDAEQSDDLEEDLDEAAEERQAFARHEDRERSIPEVGQGTEQETDS